MGGIDLFKHVTNKNTHILLNLAEKINILSTSVWYKSNVVDITMATMPKVGFNPQVEQGDNPKNIKPPYHPIFFG